MSISIVICTHNNAATLEQVLASLASQQVRASTAWDVLVVLNNCTDGSEGLVDGFARHIPATVRHVCETTPGLTPARQRGVAETEGEWIAFVDDDCVLAPDWLQNATDMIGRHPTCGGVGGLVQLDWQTGARPLPDGLGWILAAQDHGTEQEVGSLVGAGMIVRRQALEDCGWKGGPLLSDRIGRRLVSGGDAEIALRIRSAGWPLWFTPACRIRHLIPAFRTTPNYVWRIAYGLGQSQVMVQALSWPGSGRRYAASSARKAFSRLFASTQRALRDAIRRRDLRPSAVNLAFSLGMLRAAGMLARRGNHIIGALLPAHRGRTYPPGNGR